MDLYPGRIASKLYTLNTDTCLEGKFIGFLVDIDGSPAKRNNITIYPRIKKFISIERNINIPEYIFVISKLMGNGLKAYEMGNSLIKQKDFDQARFVFPVPLDNALFYTEIIVDENLKPTNAGVLKRFDQDIGIQGYNR